MGLFVHMAIQAMCSGRIANFRMKFIIVAFTIFLIDSLMLPSSFSSTYIAFGESNN